MNLVTALWRDESGVVVTSEVVVVGTVAVLGTTAGLSLMSDSVNAEFRELASALRSLDQSYRTPGQRCGLAYTAGSCYEQPAVEESLATLCAALPQPEPRPPFPMPAETAPRDADPLEDPIR